MANGWLSPTGEFHPCPIGQHRIKAQDLIQEGNTETWIAVSPSSAFSELRPTQEQISWLSQHSQYKFWIDLMLEMAEEKDNANLA